jgi:hypothetical protein
MLTFNFVEKNRRHFLNIWIYKAKLLMFGKHNLKKRLHILEGGASVVQVVILTRGKH